MRSILHRLIACAWLGCLAAGALRALPERPRADAIVPFCNLYLDPHDKFTRVMPEPDPARGRTAPSSRQIVSNISVNYTGFTTQAQAAFQTAVDIWQTQVSSQVPLVVDATFTTLGTNVLGSAGFNGIYQDFPGAPRGHTFFPAPIANKLSGVDRNGATAEITARFNSAFNWYYGTDGLTPSGQVDFISVVLHELGHGLGFAGSAFVSSSGTGSVTSVPYIYDASVVDSTGVSILDAAAYPSGSAALGALLTGNNLFWDGANAKAANGGARPRLYAPAAYAAGSTYSHVDEATYPAGSLNSLMSPILGFAEAIHVPGPIVTGVYNDMGWGSVCSLGLDHPFQAIAAGASPSLKLAVSTAPTCTWTAATTDSFVHITSGASGSGAAVVGLTVDANAGSSQRRGTVTVTAGNLAETQSLIVIQSGTCAYALNATTAAISSAGGTATVGVTAAAGCAWTAATAPGSFAVVTAGASGTGNGSVTFGGPAIAAGTSRVTTAMVAGSSVTITQGAPCSYALSATGANVAAAGGASSVTVSTASGCPWTVSTASTFISAAPAGGSGSGTATITTAANTGTLPRSGTLTIAGQTFSVTQAGVPAPAMTIDRAALNFGAVVSTAAFSFQTPAQVVRLTQNGAGAAVSWTATSNQPWLTVTPASGVGSGTLTLAVGFAGGTAAAGSLNGAVTIAYTGASTASSIINATLSLPAQTLVPFGAFDTPASGSTGLQGSLAVTGWALDDVAVSRVELWRDLQPGETTPPFASTPADPRTGKVFIANAAFVEGARPDVESLYPSSPLSYRAGWGYLLLTQGLWNQGNGTYVLSAFAFDAESHVTALGRKTIAVSNRTATRPFGSIDAPGIGAAVAGTAVNSGWALTPAVNGAATCRIPAGGVQVSIDSGPLQPVTFGAARGDIAAAFPGLSNSAGAGGSYVFDTTGLANGIHTIGWLVTDDCNRSDGIGSRFFSVNNGSLTATPHSVSAASLAARRQMVLSAEPITVARGYGELPSIVEPDADGERVVRVAQEERVEVRLPPAFETAFQLVNGERRALPAGATWDAASQTFFWRPGAPYLGEFQVVFAGGGEVLRVLVLVERVPR